MLINHHNPPFGTKKVEVDLQLAIVESELVVVEPGAKSTPRHCFVEVDRAGRLAGKLVGRLVGRLAGRLAEGTDISLL